MLESRCDAEQVSLNEEVELLVVSPAHEAEPLLVPPAQRHQTLGTCQLQSPLGKEGIQAAGEGGSLNRGWRAETEASLKAVLLGSTLNLLLPFVMAVPLASASGAGKGWMLVLTLLAITPLAERLGFATEQLALYTNSTVGGLLNATFGNATEMIVAIFALRSGLLRVVQLSLLGSILSNMLLVLGTAFFFGGLKHKTQHFNKTAATVSSGLLLMSLLGLMLPAMLHATHTEVKADKSELALSRFTSCVLLLAYACYLYFQLQSHRELYDDPVQQIAAEQGGSESCERDDEEARVLGLWGAIFWMAFITTIIALLSDSLVSILEGAAADWNVPVAFVSVVLLPIVGNAAEHASAVMFATRNRLDISLGVAIGSSTQISLFVAPLCVVIGWASGHALDLNYHVFETAVLFVSILIVSSLLQDGIANWLKGFLLVSCYLIVAGSFYVHMEQPRVEGLERQ